MNSLKKTYKKIINNPTVDEPYYHIFTKYISAYSTAILSKTPITPNFISYLMFITGLVALYFLFFFDTLFLIYAGFCFILHNILDTIDGDLARELNKTSKFGIFFDKFTHSIINPGIYLVLFFKYKEINIYYSTFFLSISFLILIDMFLKTNFNILTNNIYSFSISKKNQKNKIIKNKLLKFFNDIFFSYIGFYHILFILGIIDLFTQRQITEYYFLIFSFVLLLKFILRFFLMIKKID